MPQINQIVEVKLVLNKETKSWVVSVTKEFAPEHGGGSQVFQEDGGGGVHRALDVARGMVTMHPARRTDIPLESEEASYSHTLGQLIDHQAFNSGGRD